jgi:hypothetical protein
MLEDKIKVLINNNRVNKIETQIFNLLIIINKI